LTGSFTSIVAQLQEYWNPLEAVFDTGVFSAVIICAVIDIMILQRALTWKSVNGAEVLKEEESDPEDADEKYCET
jgi:hypothetical protein